MGGSKQSSLDRRDATSAARKKRESQSKPDVWVGFFDVPFPPDLDNDFDAWARDNETEIWDMIEASTSVGWKTSVTYNEKSGGYVAAMTGNLRQASGGIESVTAWSNSAQEAIMLLYFKLYVICEMSWDNATAQNTATKPRRG